MPDTSPQDRVNTEHLRDYSQLRRSVTDRKVAGVAGGLGRHLNIDPTILRVAFVVLSFFGGAGLLLYGAIWLFVPEEGSDTAPIQTSPSTRTTLLVVAAVLAALLLVSDSWGNVWFPWPLAVIALVAALFVMNRGKPVSTSHPSPPAGGGSGDVSAAPTAATTSGGAAAEDTSSFGWATTPPPPTPSPASTAPRPTRGPKLFWFTVALVAVALGSLGLYDVAAGGVPDAAYPALALAVVGTMLVVGAWFGRPGGLIALGLVAVLAMLGASANDLHSDEWTTTTPTSAAAVSDRYTFTAGATHLDLSRVGDLAALDGRSIEVDGNAGRIVVTLPDNVDVNVKTTIAGAGEITVLGDRRSGVGVVNLDRVVDGGEDVPAFDLDLSLVVGNIEVRQ